MLSKIYSSAEGIDEILWIKNIDLVLVDDNLIKTLEIPKHIQVIKESKIREKHHKLLMCLADNLANYFRILLKSNPRKFREEQRKLTK